MIIQEVIMYGDYAFVLSTLFIILFNIFFYKYIHINRLKYEIIYKFSIFTTLILPVLFNIYYLYFHIKYEKTHHSKKEELEELLHEMNLEKESKIPMILFGLGLFITKLKKPYIAVIFPYLLSSLVFGTLLAELTQVLTFDFKDIERLKFMADIEFSLIITSHCFLLMSILLTLLFYTDE